MVQYNESPSVTEISLGKHALIDKGEMSPAPPPPPQRPPVSIPVSSPFKIPSLQVPVLLPGAGGYPILPPLPGLLVGTNAGGIDGAPVEGGV